MDTTSPLRPAAAAAVAAALLVSGCGGKADREAAGTSFRARTATLPTDTRTRIVLPTGRIAVAFEPPVTTLPKEVGGTERRAPDGGVLLGVVTAFQRGSQASVPFPELGGRTVASSATLVADGKRYPLGAVVDPRTALGAAKARRVFVALPARPKAYALEVRFDGVAQTLDGRTGRTSSTVEAALGAAPPETTPTCPEQEDTTDQTVSYRMISCEVGVSRLPWVPEAGWAGTGRTWAITDVHVYMPLLFSFTGSPNPGGDVEYRIRTTLQLSQAGARPAAQTRRRGGGGGGDLYTTARFRVRADAEPTLLVRARFRGTPMGRRRADAPARPTVTFERRVALPR